MDRSRVERRIEEFKGRVVRSAAELFATRGIEATKLDDIADAADVAKRTLSNHFATKAEIVDAVAEAAVSRLVALIDGARQNGRTTRERLGLLFEAMQKVDLEDPFGATPPTAVHPDFAVGLFRHRSSPEESAQREIRISDAIHALLAAGGPKQLPPGCPVEVLADLVLGAIYAITLESSFRDDYEADHHLASVRAFLVGLLPGSDTGHA